MAIFTDPLALPVSLSEQWISLRRETDADYPFLEELYLSVRWDELSGTAWTDQIKLNFLRHQFSLQYRHYMAHYGGTDFGILEFQGQPIGRWYVFRSSSDLRVVDVSLLPAWRGQGIATELFRQLLAEARNGKQTASIHVEKFNPAQRLYRRLGFQEVEESGPYWLMRWSQSHAA